MITSASLSVYPGNGDGTFGDEVLMWYPQSTSLRLGDVDRDGRIDLLVGTHNNGHGRVVVFRNISQ